MTNVHNLGAEDRESFARPRLEFLALGALWEQRAELRAIFEGRTVVTPERGRERFEEWMAGVQALGLAALDTFCQTLANWMGRSPTTSARGAAMAERKD